MLTRRNTKRFSRFLGILALLLSVMNVYAEEADSMPALDPAKKGTLTVEVADGTKTVDGVTFTAYKVADITVTAGTVVYTLVEPFDTTDVVFAGMTTSQSMTAAKKLKEKTTGATGAEATTDATGKALFTNLDAGMYLIVDKAHKATGASYNTLEPFLVSVPTATMGKKASENKWEYEVNAKPKSQLKKKPDDVEPSVKPDGRTCQDDGYPEGYYWSEELQACVIGKYKMRIPNTSDK